MKELIAPAAESPDRRAAAAETELLLLRRIATVLTPRQRRVILLRYWFDEPVAGIAYRLQISEPAVSQLHARAIARLRITLAEIGVTRISDCLPEEK